MHEQQRSALNTLFDTFSREARAIGVSDQQIAEWLLRVSSRWLKSHGVEPTNIHQWIAHHLGLAAPVPLVDAARAKNDFGNLR